MQGAFEQNVSAARRAVCRASNALVRHTALGAAVLLSLAAATIARAGDDTGAANELKKLSLEELVNVEVVSVARHPEKLAHAASAIQVITSEQIRRSGATSIPEALRLADNLDVAQKNSHDWAITARGFNTALANKLLVLIDGRTVYTPLFSGVFWDVQDYPLADIERIEVISGPGGTQWGANAVNGVINIITKHAKDTLGTYVEADAGNQLKGRGVVRYGTTLAPDVYLRVYGEYFDRGEETLVGGGGAHDGWNQGRAGFRLDAQPDKQSALTVHGDVYQGNDNITTGNTSQVSGGNLLARWSHGTADGGDVSLQVYYDRTHLLDAIAPFAINGNVVAGAGFLSDDLDTYDIDFQDRFRLGERHTVQWGLAYRYTHDSVENAPAIAVFPPTLNQDLYSGFVQDEIAFGHNVTLTVGSKLEHNDYTGLEAEPSVRLQWNRSDTQTLWAAVSRAVRTPSRVDRDLVEPNPAAFPIAVLAGSEQFVSETVLAYEVGYRTQVGTNLAFSTAAFYNYYDHVRSTSITPATLLPLFFQNNLEGETHGLELAADYSVSDDWRVHAGITPLREHLHVKPGEFDFNAALNEIADPKDRASLRSSWDLPHDTELDASLRWSASRDINNGPTIAVVPSYWQMDLRFGWHVNPHLELSLVGQDLLHDQRVEYGYPGAQQVEIGRSVYGKAVWHF